MIKSCPWYTMPKRYICFFFFLSQHSHKPCSVEVSEERDVRQGELIGSWRQGKGEFAESLILFQLKGKLVISNGNMLIIFTVLWWQNSQERWKWANHTQTLCQNQIQILSHKINVIALVYISSQFQILLTHRNNIFERENIQNISIW